MMKKQLLNIKDFVHINLSRGDKNEVLTENLINAEKRVDSIRHTCQTSEKKLASCLQTCGTGSDHTSIEKRLKKMPAMHLYQCFAECSEQLGTDSVLGQTLTECSKLQNALCRETLQNEIEIEEQCLNALRNIIDFDLPSVSKSRKQLNRATADMESYRIKYHTMVKQTQPTLGSKIESLKKDLEDSTLKVDQSRDMFATEMFTLLSREPEYAQIFVNLFRLQANFYGRMKEIFEQYLPDLEDVIANAKQKPVFGTPLDQHLRVTSREISIVIEMCIGWLLNHLNEEGLFRIPGSASKIRKLKSAFDAGIVDNEEYSRDPHTVACTLKSYLRELPQHIFTYALYQEWINAAKISDTESRLQALWKVCQKLPKTNFENLKYLIKFLTKLSNNSESNKMSSQNLSIAIAPSLIWAPNSDNGQFDVNMTAANLHSIIVDSLINYADYFFPGEVNFVTHNLASEKLINGDINNYSDLPTNTSSIHSTAKSHLVHRPAKKQAPPAPIPQSSSSQKTSSTIDYEREGQKDLSSSPEQNTNLINPEVNSIGLSDKSSSVYSGSLDRNKIKSDKRVTRQLSSDKRSFYRHKIEKPSVPPPSVPPPSIPTRPMSVYDKSFRPERPQRSCDNAKVKQRSLDNLNGISSSEENDTNENDNDNDPGHSHCHSHSNANSKSNSNSDDPELVDFSSENSENSLIVVEKVILKSDNSVIFNIHDDEQENDKDILTFQNDYEPEFSNEKNDTTDGLTNDQIKPIKPPRTTSPIYNSNNNDSNKSHELSNENSINSSSTFQQQRPPRPQLPSKPRVNNSYEKTYL